jgi:leucyl aminopeptidase
MEIHLVDGVPKGKGIARVVLKEQKNNDVIVLTSGQQEIRIGIEDRSKINKRKLILLFRKVIALARANRIKKLAFDFKDFRFASLSLSDGDLAESTAINFEMANFEFVEYKTKPPEGWNFVEEIFVSGAVNREARKGFLRGQTIGREVNATRALANTPGGEMTPKLLADAAKRAMRGTRVKVKVLGLAEMKKLCMGGILGVAQGSDEEPRFIILEYFGLPRAKSRGAKNEKPTVLVGKGVTFDTGGLNLKPSDYIYEMHMDMSGGAAVIHAVALAAKLKLKKNIVGIVPAVENMPSGSSYRPGDLLKSMSGKTIEVLNTDAEGRIILADALTYAQKYKPALVVDVATLTGAAMGALGGRASAFFTSDPKLEKLFRELGEESGDYMWPLPLWEEYEEEIKGTFGDVANVGKTRYGGAITGAVFLWQFIKNPSNPSRQVPWVHIDMAPRMTSVEGEFLAKGAAGAPVRLLIKLLER